MSDATPALWQRVRHKLDWDGSLRDIYVVETTLADWQCLLGWIRRSPYGLVFSVDGIQADLPRTADRVLRMPRESHALMTLHVGGLHIHCHFFTESKIELDIDPRETSAQQLPHLLAFLAALGGQLRKNVQVTPENDRDRPFLIYDHQAREAICCP